MKRRYFILATLATTAIIAVPAIKCKWRNSLPGDPLLRPDVLSRFCDKETICQIGKEYISGTPSESVHEKLKDLILTDESGKRLLSTDRHDIADWINRRVHQDFVAERVAVVEGWVLSLTELRQCALLSLDCK